MDFEGRERGKWVAGPNTGKTGYITGYRASNLLTTRRPGPSQDRVKWGDPAHFQLDDGRAGPTFLSERLPFPSTSAFFYGCIRQAIHDASRHAHLGCWCGNANFSGDYYFVDNQQGDDAAVHFPGFPDWTACYGLLHNTDPWREYDATEHLGRVPEHERAGLEALLGEYRAMRGETGVTGVFYSGPSATLQSTEPFHVLYAYGFEVMEGELLADEPWVRGILDQEEREPDEAALIRDRASIVIEVARQFARDRRPVSLARAAFERLFPPGADERDLAIGSVCGAQGFVKLIEQP